MSRVPGIKEPDPWDMRRLLRLGADWRHGEAQGKENDAPMELSPLVRSGPRSPPSFWALWTLTIVVCMALSLRCRTPP
jgi:hypothetical protein